VADIPSGLSLKSLHEIEKRKTFWNMDTCKIKKIAIKEIDCLHARIHMAHGDVQRKALSSGSVPPRMEICLQNEQLSPVLRFITQKGALCWSTAVNWTFAVEGVGGWLKGRADSLERAVVHGGRGCVWGWVVIWGFHWTEPDFGEKHPPQPHLSNFLSFHPLYSHVNPMERWRM
jgi:hypothetical protein